MVTTPASVKARSCYLVITPPTSVKACMLPLTLPLSLTLTLPLTLTASVKACMLKLLELLHLVETGAYSRNLRRHSKRDKVARLLRLQRKPSAARLPQQGVYDKGALTAQAAWAVQLLGVWRGAYAVIDEVDLVFHPLRSELNWPLGDKYALDFAPHRWQLPMTLLEAMLA